MRCLEHYLRRFALAFFVLSLTACGLAQDEDTEEIAQNPATNPPVFQITNADGDIEGWMLGTIHALPDGVVWRTGATQRAIGDADLLVVEVANLSDTSKIAETMAKLSTSRGLPDLPERVNPQLADSLAELVEKSRFSMSDFKTTETWAVALFLSNIGSTGKPANGVDKAVIRDFAGRQIKELEGAEKQLGIFDSLAIADQRDLLEGVLIESSLGTDAAQKLREAWLRGDLSVLEGATRSGIMADPELRDALLLDRNVDWTAQLLPILEDAPKPLIAVGAAHLVGPDGLPALLEREGYTVELYE